MKYLNLLLLLVLTSSCAVNKLIPQYLNNDDVCFCGIDNRRLEDEPKYDLSTLDFNDVNMTTGDTLISNKDTLMTWAHDKHHNFMFTFYDKRTMIKIQKWYSSNGTLVEKSSSFYAIDRLYFPVGVYIYTNNNGIISESNENYIKPFDLERETDIPKKYPICWREALNLIEAKKRNFKLTKFYREIESTPNKYKMQYYWRIEIRKGKNRSKQYYVDAVTGKIKKVPIVIWTISSDDMLE